MYHKERSSSLDSCCNQEWDYFKVCVRKKIMNNEVEKCVWVVLLVPRAYVCVCVCVASVT